MKLHFNDEQCKHLAVTLRTLSAGMLIPALLNLLGLSSIELGYGKMTIMALFAIAAEFAAYMLLKQFDANDIGGY